MAPEHSPVMCIGLGCPVRERCWRCRGVSPEEWERWFNQLPYDFERRRCSWFISIHPQPPRRQPQARLH